MREVYEDAGLTAALLPRPAAVAVRSLHPKWLPTLALSYATILPLSTQPIGEEGQPAAWKTLADEWDSTFPDDRDRILAYVTWLTENVG